MRLWSLHPMYLDKIGAVAQWKEGLQAIASEIGISKMFKNHPQKKRFKNVDQIKDYLYWLYVLRQDINFNEDLLFKYNKTRSPLEVKVIPVNSGQIAYEQWFLFTKLMGRNRELAIKLLVPTDKLILHPMLYKVNGPIHEWEKAQ